MRKKWIWIACGLGIFVVLPAFESVYFCWVWFHTILMLLVLLFGVLAGVGLLTIIGSHMYLRDKWKRFKSITMCCIGMMGSLVIVYLMLFEASVLDMYRDIPDYLRGDYAYVEGVAIVTIAGGGKSTTYKVAVDRMKLEYHLREHPRDLQGYRVGMYYLAHSKYVVKMVKFPYP